MGKLSCKTSTENWSAEFDGVAGNASGCCYILGMAMTRTTFTVDENELGRARELGVNVSQAARDGLAAAMRLARAEQDRAAYLRRPEKPDPFWEDTAAWSDGE